MAPEYVMIKIREDVHKMLKMFAKHHRYDLQEYASSLLLDSLSRYEVLKLLAPNYSYTFHDDQMLITDGKQKRVYTLWLKDNRLYCEEDKSTECDHVYFALMTPELMTLWIGKGKKQN